MLKSNGKLMDNIFCYGMTFVVVLVIALPTFVA